MLMEVDSILSVPQQDRPRKMDRLCLGLMPVICGLLLVSGTPPRSYDVTFVQKIQCLLIKSSAIYVYQGLLHCQAKD
jgi:hypothetical protein